MRNKIFNALLLAALVALTGCSGAGSDAAATGSADATAAADIPAECQRYIQALAKCTDGRPSTAEEAEQTVADMVQAYKDNGSAAATPEQCTAAADALEGSC